MADNPALTARPETSIMATPDVRSRGIAPIKAEYLIDLTPTVESTSTSLLNSQSAHLDDEAEGTTSADPRDSKRRKGNNGKKAKGQNKNRHFPHVRESGAKMCRLWETTGTCTKDGCRFSHNWTGYFESKFPDVRYDPTATFSSEAPFVQEREGVIGGEDMVGRTIDMGTTCPVLSDLGYCPYGWRCRFLGGHVRKLGSTEGEFDGTNASVKRIGEWELLGEKTADEKQGWKNKETNWPNYEVMNRLRSNTYEYPISQAYLSKVEPDKPFTLSKGLEREAKPKPKPTGLSEEEEANFFAAPPEGVSVKAEVKVEVKMGEDRSNGVVDGETEAIDVPLRPEEKRRLNWENGLYLAPLTTVGNLPFRRLCVSYGATITCSEMALAQPLVSGQQEEWALVRRHESEKMFGVQLAGGYPNRMVPTAEMLAREVGNGVDFVDVNLGCPIDLVFNQGAGSALLDNPGRLGKILVGMNRALGEVPLTVKFRTGVASNKSNAHKLIPRFATEWGASAMTLHGRSRQQRYTKEANWDYIRQCATTLREHLADAGHAPVPIFGNGDCYSAHSYYEEKEKSGVDGVMVARGALIKPWIFTEIAERREWDISATERLDGIRKFAEFGLSHWGSDTQGINITRRFLCEALSFQHRYIPIGLLERLPSYMNDRPPAFRGRSELETLLSSPFSGDWVKISEMFLGKVGDEFRFVPKHKSNAYGAEEAQG